jgi:hypothetical protein
MAVSATLAVKVSGEFARRYRSFCESHFLQVGKFTEQALLEVMEDYHFGLKAQAVLSRTSGEATDHGRYFAKKKRPASGTPRRRPAK